VYFPDDNTRYSHFLARFSSVTLEFDLMDLLTWNFDFFLSCDEFQSRTRYSIDALSLIKVVNDAKHYLLSDFETFLDGFC
jgi:hypothetical protein